MIIFLATCKDLGVGWWSLKNPYGLRILKPLKIIGRSLKKGEFQGLLKQTLCNNMAFIAYITYSI